MEGLSKNLTVFLKRRCYPKQTFDYHIYECEETKYIKNKDCVNCVYFIGIKKNRKFLTVECRKKEQ